MLAGATVGGGNKKILLPITPEYIGYADLGLSDHFFKAVRPKIDYIGEDLFKYRVDFDAITLSDEIAAICVSRPTNPTGNVLTDDEVTRLADMAAAHSIPLILDNAYGIPFPGIVFRDVEPFWDDNVILCMSLSKIGLPAVRTGIMIARRNYMDEGLARGAAWAERYPGIHRLLVNKYWIDEIYDRWIVRPLAGLANWLHRFIDGFLIDGVLVHGSAFFAEMTGDLLRFTTTGNVRNYALYFLLGLLAMFWWML